MYPIYPSCCLNDPGFQMFCFFFFITMSYIFCIALVMQQLMKEMKNVLPALLPKDWRALQNWLTPEFITHKSGCKHSYTPSKTKNKTKQNSVPNAIVGLTEPFLLKVNILWSSSLLILSLLQWSLLYWIVSFFTVRIISWSPHHSPLFM